MPASPGRVFSGLIGTLPTAHCTALQMEREARYNHYVSSLQCYNTSKLDDFFRQRVVHMAGVNLVELQPHVASGKPWNQAVLQCGPSDGLLPAEVTWARSLE